jgi:3-methyladenine DNA glycosylase AlkC
VNKFLIHLCAIHLKPYAGDLHIMDFKDHFDYQLAQHYADRVFAVDKRFDQSAFSTALGENLLSLEMKDRVNAIADSLWLGLSLPYREAISIILKAVEATGTKAAIRGFPAWVASQVIETYGVDDFETSMAAIYRITQLFTGEFAIRPFLDRYPEQAFARLTQWADDHSTDVRRLVSEGARPRLPWASRVPALITDPAPIFKLLELLKNDPEEFVRRSVANNLNDIAKDHPDEVVAMVSKWQQTLPVSKERDWMIRHSLRSLLKNGHPSALSLMGFDQDLPVEVNHFSIEPQSILMGESVQLSCQLDSFNETPSKLMVDIIWWSPGANGKKNRKVFKWSKRELSKAASIKLDKQLSLKANSVRKVYPGEHEIHLIINGHNKASSVFEVIG